MNLSETDLIVDQIYGGSREGNASDDPLPQLLRVDSGAGFRHLGPRPHVNTLKLLVLKTNFNDPDWPDRLDTETGIFTYYGDNKTPGDLHKTPRKGNAILRNLFIAAHDPTITDHFPAIFLFGGTGVYRDLKFLGLAVPGAIGVGPDEDLVAIWRTSGADSTRFQNYRSIFTVVDAPVISRQWIKDIQVGDGSSSPNAPKSWIDWLKSRKYTPLIAPHSIDTRTKEQQQPQTKAESDIVNLIYEKYKDNPYNFEHCAITIATLMLPNILSWELTRPYRDGGRDAIGKYRIGPSYSNVDVDFALEAKCYSQNSGVGVKELSRLISRLRHRQFGILVTTSYLAAQAYKELKEDRHPVIVISASDIAKILHERIGSIDNIISWLDTLEQN